jgi:hypothetical protein
VVGDPHEHTPSELIGASVDDLLVHIRLVHEVSGRVGPWSPLSLLRSFHESLPHVDNVVSSSGEVSFTAAVEGASSRARRRREP